MYRMFTICLELMIQEDINHKDSSLLVEEFGDNLGDISDAPSYLIYHITCLDKKNM